MKKPYIIGIAGGSASGKTWLVKRLRERFPEEEVCIISHDNYYRPVHEQVRDENGDINFDEPEGIDNVAFMTDLKSLSAGQEITRNEYGFNNPGHTPRELHFKPAPVIIAEGIFVLCHHELGELMDLKVFIEAHEEVTLQRRLKRDLEERGLPPTTTLYQWQNHVLPAYKRYLIPCRAEADIIITNNEGCDRGLEVIADHVGRRVGRNREQKQ